MQSIKIIIFMSKQFCFSFVFHSLYQAELCSFVISVSVNLHKHVTGKTSKAIWTINQQGLIFVMATTGLKRRMESIDWHVTVQCPLTPFLSCFFLFFFSPSCLIFSILFFFLYQTDWVPIWFGSSS